jgi:tetratricopeptide (TPR) repeat protein
LKNVALWMIAMAVAPAARGEQRFHSPAEILKLLSESKIVYRVEAKASPGGEEKERPVLPGSVFIGSRPDGTRAVMTFDQTHASSPEASAHLAAAEKAFQEKRWAEARSEYSAALRAVPESSQIMTFIGQTHGIEGDVDEAREWYERALEQNPVDYLSWLLLADLDRMAGRLDSSVERITRAHLLNRNNPRVLKMLEDIYELAGHRYEPWEVAPTVEVFREESGDVRIAFEEGDSSDWPAYAMCRALWRYEPGYREKMSLSTELPPRLLEEEECLLVALESAMTKRDAEPGSELSEAMMRIERAVKNGDLADFALYEIILVEEPLFAYTMNEGALASVGKYVTVYH